jgi:hypothetical protein
MSTTSLSRASQRGRGVLEFLNFDPAGGLLRIAPSPRAVTPRRMLTLPQGDSGRPPAFFSADAGGRGTIGSPAWDKSGVAKRSSS